jgi:hypothetical protein
MAKLYTAHDIDYAFPSPFPQTTTLPSTTYPNLALLLRRRGEAEHNRHQMHEFFRRLVFILIDNTDDYDKEPCFADRRK